MKGSLIELQEPRLLFAMGQTLEDPRDGLTLFGPLDKGQAYGIRYGVIGTKDGISRLASWIDRIQRPVTNVPAMRSRPPFPGFEAAFGVPWRVSPTLRIEIAEHDLRQRLYLDDRYKRVYETADFFANLIIDAIANEEQKPDVWFIIVPDDLHLYCRPKSVLPTDIRIAAEGKMKRREGLLLQKSPSLFAAWNRDAVAYQYEPDFHNQLKARLLKHLAPTQIIRESTIAYRDFTDRFGQPKRNLSKLESAIAWHIGTAAYYKAGARPWKLSGVREGVCYLGLVFKRDDNDPDPRTACCAAQMFLDSGDGVVFKGNLGPWYTGKRGEYHLNLIAAHEIMEQAMNAYRAKHNGAAPKEVFIHGKIRFSDAEWAGFEEVAGRGTKLVGVRIRTEGKFRLYRQHSELPVLRGLAYLQHERFAYLWTRGFVPRLQTYPGREVPRPLMVDLCRGDADIRVVLQDIMGLTKLNYNACCFADGEPVTLKFADAVGEILTSGPIKDQPPLAFRYYI